MSESITSVLYLVHCKDVTLDCSIARQVLAGATKKFLKTFSSKFFADSSKGFTHIPNMRPIHRKIHIFLFAENA